MGWTRRLLALALALTLVGAACSSDDDDTATDAAADSSDSADDAGDESTDDAAEEPAEDDAADGGDDAAAADGAVPIELGEWFIGLDQSLSAGTITFTVENTGENPHAFAIVRGDAYEDLPLLDNGAIDTDAVGDDFLGTTDNFETGEGGEITFDLEAGNYVFFCPIQFGPNSHAAAGQVMSVTVG